MLTWLHIGDLHASGEDSGESVAVMAAIAREAAALGGAVHFVFLPGDVADHGEAEQYRRVSEALAADPQPVAAIPGDHDFEPGTLDAFHAGLARFRRTPELAFEVQGCRCIFLDVVSAGSGGPDFRLDGGQRAWLQAQLVEAREAHQKPVLFMHAFPGDLADGDALARAFALNDVAFADTGHTHCNELLNDGRTLYGATRSTGQIEEGCAGYSLHAVDGEAVSWRFKPVDAPFPFVLITSPGDRRLVTRRVTQAPAAAFSVRARVFGARPDAAVRLTVDAERPVAMAPAPGEPGVWSAQAPALPPGRHALRVHAVQDGEADTDVVEVDVGWREATPAPGRLADHSASAGAWPARGLMGARLGPNAEGTLWAS